MTLEDVANLMLLPIVRENDPWHITLTSKELAMQVALKKVMRKNNNASSHSERGEYNERFLLYQLGRVTNGKALKEYPMVKCNYTSGTAPLACSWIGKRQIMPRTFGPPEVSFFNNTFPAVLGNQVYGLYCGRLKPSRDASNDNTIHATMHYMAGDMEFRVLLPKKSCEAWAPICQPVPGMTEEVYGQIGAVGEELGQKATGGVRAGEKVGEAVPSKRSTLGKRKNVAHPFKSRACMTFTSPTSKQGKANVPTPSKARVTKAKETNNDNNSDESSWGNPDPEVGILLGLSFVCLFVIVDLTEDPLTYGLMFVSLLSWSTSLRAQVKAIVARGGSHDSHGHGRGHGREHKRDMERSRGRPCMGSPSRHAGARMSGQGRPYSSDPASFTTESVKKAKANELPPQKPSMGRHEDFIWPEIAKIQLEAMVLKLRPINELPPFRASDFELVPRGFISKKKVVTTVDEKGKKVTEEINSDSSNSNNNKFSGNDALSESENGFKQGGKDVGFRGGIDINRVVPEELESNVGDVAKKSISSKGKVDPGTLAMSSTKKVVSPNKTEHNGEPSSVPTKLGETDDFAARLLKNLASKFAVLAMLEAWAHDLLDIFPNLTTRSKAKKMVVEDTFSILYATMRHMEVTLFDEMNDDFFYLCRDAIDDVESINFEDDVIHTHLSNLAKAYLRKTMFGMAGSDMVESLDECIKEQAKHVKKLQKSLIETKELVLKLEKGLVLTKGYMGSLNQEKKCLSSNGAVEVHQTCIEAGKAFKDEPGLFLP
ncbi:hypothetical protein SLEP1_g49439 [Rubroshorea leprosula]|uniref:Uncharacterized protein n=1 Tax=Rubroshorea leprosula TaxID=152421 RepID=A0AAV5LWT3_9ROSI|nr:hypothetical protein SLEP1_g49439 [Rubroshorea leprosula]